MSSDKIREIFEKLPLSFLVFVYLAYLAYGYYSFTNDSNSPLLQKRQQIELIKQQNGKLETKIIQLSDFARTLESKKEELRRLAQDLQEMKTNLPEELDIPEFMKTVITEAKKVGLTVLSLKPNDTVKAEYYVEQKFTMTFRGAFIQLLAFLERLANVTEIVRIENFDMKSTGSSRARYVELEGSVEIKTYQYVGSKADMLGQTETQKIQSLSSTPIMNSNNNINNSNNSNNSSNRSGSSGNGNSNSLPNHSGMTKPGGGL